MVNVITSYSLSIWSCARWCNDFHSSMISRRAHTEFFGNPTGYMFLAASRHHKFLLSHESIHLTYIHQKSNPDYVNNSHSNSTAYMPVPSLGQTDPWHTTDVTRKRDAKAEHLAQIKAALSLGIQNINFVDPILTKRAHEALKHEVNRNAIEACTFI